MLNEFEASLTMLSPKFFPIFIYQALFLAMFESSLDTTSSSDSRCFCVKLQEIIFQTISGIYGYFWIRGALFGGFRANIPKFLRIGILILTQVLRYLFTKLLRYAITFKYGNEIMESCPYIAHVNMFIIILISALIALAFACSGLGAIGFLISGPICYTLWERAYFMKLAGWVLKKSNDEFNSGDWVSKDCPYDEPNFMLWLLPTVCWLLFNLILEGVRYLMRNRGIVQVQVPDSYNNSAEFSKKQYQLVDIPYNTKKLPEKAISEKECSICWENFVGNEKVSYVEECYHIYHSACINKWVAKSQYCPLCKRRIKLKYF